MRQAIRTTGNNLVGLWRPSFVKVDERLFVFGGGGNVTNDLHILNLYNMKWETAQVICHIFLHVAMTYTTYSIRM